MQDWLLLIFQMDQLGKLFHYFWYHMTEFELIWKVNHSYTPISLQNLLNQLNQMIVINFHVKHVDVQLHEDVGGSNILEYREGNSIELPRSWESKKYIVRKQTWFSLLKSPCTYTVPSLHLHMHLQLLLHHQKVWKNLNFQSYRSEIWHQG